MDIRRAADANTISVLQKIGHAIRGTTIRLTVMPNTELWNFYVVLLQRVALYLHLNGIRAEYRLVKESALRHLVFGKLAAVVAEVQLVALMMVR